MPRVLVVDDDPNVRDLIAFRLRKAGHRVLCAESGAEALELVESRGAPDVAVLDVSMPDMSGLELLPTMRARDGLADMPAIFLSGLVDHATWPPAARSTPPTSRSRSAASRSSTPSPAPASRTRKS